MLRLKSKNFMATLHQQDKIVCQELFSECHFMPFYEISVCATAYRRKRNKAHFIWQHWNKAQFILMVLVLGTNKNFQ